MDVQRRRAIAVASNDRKLAVKTQLCLVRIAGVLDIIVKVTDSESGDTIVSTEVVVLMRSHLERGIDAEHLKIFVGGALSSCVAMPGEEKHNVITGIRAK